MQKRQFRGITGAVRKAINRGDIKGEIKFSEVRKLLPQIKRKAPDKVIRGSLNQMARNHEIKRFESRFFTKDIKIPTVAKQSVPGLTPYDGEIMVIGKLVNTSIKSGKMIVEVEVSSLDTTK